MENTNLRTLFQLIVRRFGFLNDQCCDKCCGEDISAVQSHILFEVKRQSSPSMQDVAKALGLDITTFSRQVKTLVDKGYVKKTPHPNDNRVNLLSLTAKGENVEGNIDNEMNQYIANILSHLSEYECESVVRSIQLLNNAMQKTIPPR